MVGIYLHQHWEAAVSGEAPHTQRRMEDRNHTQWRLVVWEAHRNYWKVWAYNHNQMMVEVSQVHRKHWVYDHNHWRVWVWEEVRRKHWVCDHNHWKVVV